jgi:cytochrome c5
MSASHHDAHAAPEQPELTHPLLWTGCMLAIIAFLVWLFFSNPSAGRVVGRHHGPIQVGEVGEPEPDHKALITNRSQETLDEGAQIYGAKCASCHGPQGDSNPSKMNPAPRNFRADPWKNPQGGGPYALYCVMAHGMGTMPAFPGLTPKQRYAVIHFIRETWVKTSNPANYVESDPEEVAKTIPAPGAAGAAEGVRDPRACEITVPLQPLLAGIAHDQEAAQRANAAWVQAALAGATAPRARSLASLAELAQQQPGLLAQVHQAVEAGDAKRFAALLAGSDGSGAVRAQFSLLSDAELADLFQALKGGK